jgi:ubiquitin carboxyl-terminal hydrolase 25/28
MYGVISFMFLYPSLKVIMLLVISQLADLFWQLEYCEAAAVTPTIELAKLALVTSRDEEEDEADKGGTDSSNDTDATLVDDTPTRFSSSDQPPRSPARSPGSVLGKRPRDIDRQVLEIDVESATTEGFVIVSPLGQINPMSPKGEASSSKSREMSISPDGGDGDIEMGTSQRNSDDTQNQHTLAPRKPVEISNSVMMFGNTVLCAPHSGSDESL